MGESEVSLSHQGTIESEGKSQKTFTFLLRLFSATSALEYVFHKTINVYGKIYKSNNYWFKFWLKQN